MHYIYLDDERNPKTDHNWQVCRSVNEFMQAIYSFDFKSYERLYISLDHDLGENIPTGYDAIKQFVKFLIDNDISKDFIACNIFINVHSANPIGRVNIEDYWNCFIRNYII